VPDRKQRGAAQHQAEIDGGIGAGQVHFQQEGLGQPFLQRKFNDFK